MMQKPFPFLAAMLCAALAGCAATPARSTGQAARAQVTATERAFARTMAERDPKAFASFVSREAVFMSDAGPLRGRDAVVKAWAHYFDGPVAPFSWEPDQVEVLDSGTLALSSGPVRDGHGTLIARFTSVWRQESPGVWRIVLDKGNPVCAPDS